MRPHEAAESLSRQSSLTLPPGAAVGQGPLALQQRRLWLRLGVESCRVWAIDRATGTPSAGRWMSDGGRTSALVAGDHGLDSAGPGVVERLEHWAHQHNLPFGDGATHMLSPRRWLLFWPVGDHAALLAQLRFQQAKTALDADDMALTHLLCESWLSEELATLGERQMDRLGWNQVDRRARGPVPPALTAAMLALLLSAAAGLWTVFWGASAVQSDSQAQQQQITRIAELADQTMVRGLSHVLAAGDYGELQDLLAEKTTIGQLESAVIVNARGQAVAQVGSTPGVRLGLPVPPALESAARSLALAKDGQALGRLLITKAPAAADPGMGGSVPGLRLAGVLVAVLALAAAGLLGWYLRPRYRSGWLRVLP